MSIHHKVGSELVEFASKVSFDDASQKLTINGIEHQVGQVVVGQEGEVPYLTPDSGFKKQTILRSDIYVCESQDDINKSLNTSFSLKEVYDTWIKGGHNSAGKWYSYTDYPHSPGNIAAWLAYNNEHGFHPNSFAELTDGEPKNTWQPPNTEIYGGWGYPFWTYNQNSRSIIQTINTGDYSFYASPVNYLNYDLTFDVQSYNGDDDIIGFIAAMNVDQDTGIPHILCFNRTPNNTNGDGPIQPAFHWYCQIDSSDMVRIWSSTTSMISSIASLSAKNLASRGILSGLMTNTITQQWWKENHFNNWNNYMEDWRQISSYDSPPSPTAVPYAAGVDYQTSGYSVVGSARMRIRREENMISAWTSEFGSSQLENRIVVNLDNLKDKAGNSIPYFSTASFPTGGQIGFSTLSQPLAYFKIIEAKLPKTIIDAQTNSISVYNPIADEWSLDTSQLPPSYIGAGRLTRNNATGKTFYVTPNSFIKIGEVEV